MVQFLQVVWLNVAFWILFPIVTIAFAMIGTVYVTIFALCVRDHRRTMWLIRRSIVHYGMAIIRCGWPLVRVRYIDHSPQDKPPFIFVANHRSTSDAFLLAYLPCELVQVVNIWPFKIPVLGVMARIAGYLSVREMPFEQFLERGSQLLKQGVSIVTFPEGTRSGSSTMGPFRGSAFRLAQHAGASLVPLAISGSENIPHRGSLLLRPGNISVHKLPALTAEEHLKLSAFKLKKVVHDRLQSHLEVAGT